MRQAEIARKVIREHHGIVKTALLLEAGVTYKSILTMKKNGYIVRAKSGYYSLPEEHFSEEESLAAQFPDWLQEWGSNYRRLRKSHRRKLYDYLEG